MTWSQTQNGKDRSLWKAEYDSERDRWEKQVFVLSEGNPRFGSCVYDTQGQLWIAYSISTDKGTEVAVKLLD